MYKEIITQAVIDAFKDVSLGNGVGLWEGQAIDDYEGKVAECKARVNDEKSDWMKIPSSDLFRCESSMSFFDEEGLRFHLPAFIIAELNGALNTGILFYLLRIEDERYDLLNREQKESVAMFLDWCAWQEDYYFDWPNIRRAIAEFWRRV